MSTLELSDTDFNKFTAISEREARAHALASDTAFVAAMNAAIKRGKVRGVTAGTFVDTSPAIYSKRMRGEVQMSACGSPAAMCMEAAVQVSGAEAMK